MIFIFKRKKIILDCLTYSENVLNLYPISKASNFLPDWWKNTPKTYQTKFFNHPTIKSCNGILDNYKNGFILPFWSDFSLNIYENKSYEWQFADMITYSESHDSKQWENFSNSNETLHLKIASQWKIKTKSDIKFVWTNPFWNNSLFKKYEICTGVTDFKYNHNVNINLLIKLEKQNIFIKHNTPIIHFFPLSENEIVLKHHLISVNEFNHSNNANVFHKLIKETKKIIDKKEKKCPFNFTKG